jgi:hypothetical protein
MVASVAGCIEGLSSGRQFLKYSGRGVGVACVAGGLKGFKGFGDVARFPNFHCPRLNPKTTSY